MRQEVVKYLVNTDLVDPSASDNYAIRWAARNDHLEVLKYLTLSILYM